MVLAALAMEIALDSICTVSSNFYPLQATTNPKACLVQSKEVSLKSQRCQILLREEWDALNLLTGWASLEEAIIELSNATVIQLLIKINPLCPNPL